MSLLMAKYNLQWLKVIHLQVDKFLISFFSLLGKSVDLHEYEPEAVASLVKLYLRELPENILTVALLPKFNELSGKRKKLKNILLRESLGKLKKVWKHCLWACFHNISPSSKFPLVYLGLQFCLDLCFWFS